LASGVSSVFKKLSPDTKVIGVEPLGAPSMSTSIKNQSNTKIENVDKFVDGASVQKVGDLNFEICKANLDEMVTVHEGRICQLILDLYNKNAIVVEPAGALTTAVLDQFGDKIKGKNIVCLISGSNNDITRTEEIKERAMLHSGFKHYFVVKFPQRAGALREFLSEVLGPNDDITHFEYSKKHNRNSGPAVVGLELKNPNDIEDLIIRMKERNFFGEYLNDSPDLFQVLV
jgi:threonine dehydratase